MTPKRRAGTRTRHAPAVPRYATRRRRYRHTEGPAVAAYLTANLGVDPMPWQTQVLDTALERRADGRFFYDTVVVTVPRQSGKTTLVQALAGWRAGTAEGLRMAYTAQARKDAAERIFDLGDVLARVDPLGVTVYRAAGSERIQWSNGSRLAVVSPNAKGGHGGTYVLVIADEAWTLDTHVLQSLIPAQAAIPDAQFWLISTAGTNESHVLESFRETGREQLNQTNANVAYFEWGMDGTDLDPLDPPSWWRTHPALGYTITEERLTNAARTMPPAEFIRAYANKTVAADAAAIPVDWWDETGDPYIVPPVDDPDAHLVLSIDVNPGPAGAAIAAAFLRPDGTPHIDLIEHRAGPVASWIPQRVAALVETYRPAAIAYDARGPANVVDRDLTIVGEQTGIPVRRLYPRDVAAGCAALFDRLHNRTVTHGRDEAFDLAAAGARKKPYGDVWFWHRRRSLNDVSISTKA